MVLNVRREKQIVYSPFLFSFTPAVLENYDFDKDLWLERLGWIDLVLKLIQYSQEDFYFFKKEWQVLLGGKRLDKQGKFHAIFRRMSELWFMPFPDWNVIKAWNNYLEASEDYYRYSWGYAVLTQYDLIFKRFSGSLLQLLPYASKKYWNEITCFGVIDRVYQNLVNAVEDGKQGYCYFPKDVLQHHNLTNEHFLNGTFFLQSGYPEFISYWLNNYLPGFQRSVCPLLSASDIHPGWVVLLKHMSNRHSYIDFLLRKDCKSIFVDLQNCSD